MRLGQALGQMSLQRADVRLLKSYSPAPITLPAPGIRIYPNSCIWVVTRGTATAATLAGSYTIMER